MSLCSNVRNLDINPQTNLKPSVHSAEIAVIANARSKRIVKSFLSYYATIMARAFTIYVRPRVYNVLYILLVRPIL